MERDQRAKRGGIAIVEQEGGRGAIPRIGARGILRSLARHQRCTLRKAIHQQRAVMRRIELVTRRDAGDEVDRDQMRALVQ